MAEPAQSLRILIADDDPRWRAALRHDLERAGFEICAEAGTGPAAVAAARQERPDLCFIDVQMPGGDGITATETIRLALPATKILVMTASPDEEGTLAAARAGADGYLAKDVSPGRLPYIVRAVVAGETTFPRLLLRRLLEEIRSPALPAVRAQRPERLILACPLPCSATRRLIQASLFVCLPDT